MDFDAVLKPAGDFDRYQRLVYFLICLPAAFPSAWTAFNQVFVAATPEHRCALGPGEEAALWVPEELLDGELRASRCRRFLPDPLRPDRPSNRTGPCDRGWVFDNSTYDATIVSDFLLVCDMGHWASLSTMIFYIGSFIGNIVFGYVADKWGRRASFFSILLIQVVFGTASAFATDVYSFTALRFVVGLSFPALYQVPFVIGMELMGPGGRIFAGMVVCVFFGSAMCLLGGVASLLRRWDLITLVCNAPFVLLFSYWFFLPESPRWLVAARRYDAAADVIQNIAKWNGRTYDRDVIYRRCRRLEERGKEPGDETDERAKLADLFRTPNLRKKTLIITFIWLVNAIVYNGLTYNVSNLPVNDYLSFSINGAVEVPAYFLFWPLLSRVGRRWPLVGSMVLGGVACLSTMFVPPSYGWTVSGLAFLGKFGIAASFAILYIFAGELYPTVVRAMGMGMSSMVAGSGLILAPYLVDLGNHVRVLPLLIMGLLTLAAGFAAIFLPETLGAPLPQSLQDAELFGRHHRLLSLRPPPPDLRTDLSAPELLPLHNHSPPPSPAPKSTNHSTHLS